MLGFTTRKATTADIPSIIEVQKQTWWVTYEPIIGKEQCDYMFEIQYAESSLTHQMEEEGHQFILLLNNETICGFASLSRISDKGAYKLHKIYVTPPYQGSGGGRFLLKAAENLVRELGGSELKLNVNRMNPARHFYERAGYSILHTVDIPLGEFWMNDYVMGRKLGEIDRSS